MTTDLPPTPSIEMLFQQAVKAFQGHHYGESEKYCRAYLSHRPAESRLYNLLGVLCHRQGRPEEAMESFQKALEINPHDTECLHNLSIIALEENKLEIAQQAVTQLLTQVPEHLEGLFNQANIFKRQSRYDEAVSYYQRVLSLKPDYMWAAINWGNLYINQRQWDEALAHYLKYLPVFPDSAQLHSNLGYIYRERGELELAKQHCEKALMLNPDYADAHNNLGNVFRDLGLNQQSADCYRRAFQLKPDLWEAVNNLGNVYRTAKQYEKAREAYLMAASGQPTNGKPWHDLGYVYHELGDFDNACRAFDEAIARRPDYLPWQFHRQNLCPVILPDKQLQQQCRASIEQCLSQSPDILSSVSLSELLLSNCHPSFHLPYHGYNDYALKCAYGDYFETLLSRSSYRHLMVPIEPRQSGKIQLAFVVTHAHERVFMRILGGLILRLDPQIFDVTLLCSPSSVRLLEPYFKTAVRYLTVSDRLEFAIPQIKAERFDLVYHVEVGTDSQNYMLPFFKLGAVQCTSWGFPETSGIAAMDYFLSSRLWEVDSAASHYCEQLIRFDTLPVFYPRLQRPLEIPDLTMFGLPDNKPVVACLQQLFKIHPDFDAVLAQIAETLPDTRIALIANAPSSHVELMTARFKRVSPRLSEQIVWLPKLSETLYYQFLAHPDVVFIDTIYYDGGITSYDAMAMGAAVVTQPSELLKGRKTAALYQKMGVVDLVANSLASYVDKVVALVSDKAYRTDQQLKIVQASEVLYEDHGAITQMSAFFEQVVRSSR